MTWKTETDAQNVLDLAGRLRNFICGYKPNALPVFTGAGSGSLDAFGAANAVADQTITITCTDATTEGAEVWSVSGSVAGALPDAVSNTLYEQSGVTFIISSDSVTPFAVSDEYTIAVSGTGAMQTSGEAAALQQHAYAYNGTAASTYQFQVEFAGGGADTINIGHVARRDINNNRFLLELYGSPGYTPGLGVHEQILGSARTVIYTRNQPMTHWIVADAYGYKWAVVAGTTYRFAYCRFLTPYASPGAYSFPLSVGADSALDSLTYASQDSRSRFCADPAYQALNVMRPDNSWITVSNYTNASTTGYVSDSVSLAGNLTLPYGGSSFKASGIKAIKPNLEGEYILIPITVSTSAPETLGELEGVYTVAGFATITAGDIIQQGGDDLLVVQNIHRNTDSDYIAMRLN